MASSENGKWNHWDGLWNENCGEASELVSDQGVNLRGKTMEAKIHTWLINLRVFFMVPGLRVAVLSISDQIFLKIRFFFLCAFVTKSIGRPARSLDGKEVWET